MDHRKSEEGNIGKAQGTVFWAIAATAIAAVCLWSAGTGTAGAQNVNITADVQPSSTISLPIETSYRWYANIDALDPVTPLAAEGATATTPSAGTSVRLRMNVFNAGGVAIPAGTTFAVQYANATSGPWTAVGAAGAKWGFTTNPSVSDGSIVTTLLLSSSTVGESYGSSNPSAAAPNAVASKNYGEWDWSLLNVSAATSSNWFFRMIYASGTQLSGYAPYPEFTATTTPAGGGSSGGGGGGPPPVQVGGGGGTYPPTNTPPVAPSATVPSSPSSGPPIVPPPPVVPATCAIDAGRPPVFQRTDFNCDADIDIVDLSILLYYYNQTTPLALRYDLNGDGKVDFVDVSILMYYWTGPFATPGSAVSHV